MVAFTATMLSVSAQAELHPHNTTHTFGVGMGAGTHGMRSHEPFTKVTALVPEYAMPVNVAFGFWHQCVTEGGTQSTQKP